ncbi:MAG: hypothetical protein D6769_01830 [Methanobacteriota archaeon]|nr:MAG: hypothetical protein D6769_01830 [Euryarchaeota archaeon]
MSKAQVALEFLMFTGIFLLAFIIILALISIYGNQERGGITYLLANEIVLRLSSTFSGVYGVGEGFSYLFSLPPQLGSSSYNVYLFNNTDGSGSSIFLVANEFSNLTSTETLSTNISCDQSLFDSSKGSCVLESGSTYNISVENNLLVIHKIRASSGGGNP